MSRIIEAIEAARIGEKCPLVDVEEQGKITEDFLFEYEIGVKIGRRVRAVSNLECSYLKDHVTEEIKHFIFGEFKKDFNELYDAILNRDQDKSLKLLDKLIMKIYS